MSNFDIIQSVRTYVNTNCNTMDATCFGTVYIRRHPRRAVWIIVPDRYTPVQK